MSVEPIDIKNKEFSRSFRGYAPREVRQFLEQVAARVDGLKEELQEKEEELSRVCSERDRLKEEEDRVKDLVETARRLSNQIETEAREEADRIEEQARQEADQIRESARREMKQIREELSQLKAKRRTLREKLLGLGGEIRSFARSLGGGEDGLQNEDQG